MLASGAEQSPRLASAALGDTGGGPARAGSKPKQPVALRHEAEEKQLGEYEGEVAPGHNGGARVYRAGPDQDADRGRDGKQETDLAPAPVAGSGSDSDSDSNCEKPALPSRFIMDPAGSLTHDQTSVDIVAVPCPGADPMRSWTRDGLLGRYFGAPSMRDAEAQPNAKPPPSWVRQGIRREADRARVLLYEHPEELVAEESVTLSRLAHALLEELLALRIAEGTEGRPLIFVAHSIGGLVVKMVLVAARRVPVQSDILKSCYGVVFFGTPHQGSSYFAMPSLAASIQAILQLSHPLRASITNDLRVGNSLLLQVDEEFKTISTDVRVWTFYETIDSRLSDSGGAVDVCFTAPLTSIKSAILGMRQERIFPLQSDHANIASFGRHNVQTLRLFLRQLAAQVRRADAISRENDGRWGLDLEDKVNIEVHGFFDDPTTANPASTSEATVRAWSTRLPLRQFLRKGPEACLRDRLDEIEVGGTPHEGIGLVAQGRPIMSTLLLPRREDTAADQNALGIKNRLVEVSITAPVRPVHASKGPRIAASTRPASSPMRLPSPFVRANFDQDLAVDQLSPVLRPRVGRSISRSVSLGSEADSPCCEYRDFPPFSQRSRSALDVAPENALDSSPRLPGAVVAVGNAADEEDARERDVVDEPPAAFSKPDVNSRKFMWVHVPFNNPTWVKNVLQTLQQISHGQDLSQLCNVRFWVSKHTRGRHSQHYAYYAKPGCYYTAPRSLSRAQSVASPSASPAPGNEHMYTTIFLPYLHFDSYKRLLRRRELIVQRLCQGRAHPVPSSVIKSESLELQVIWEFLGHDPPLNCRRTLDQYGYPSLRDTRSRDDDQMLYKLTKERVKPLGQQRDLYSQWSSSEVGSDRSGSTSWRKQVLRQDSGVSEETASPEDEVLNGNVLMVDQLWLWVIGSHTLLSFFPKRESDPIEGPLYQQADLRDSIFNEVNVDLTRQCDNALDLAALAVLHAVSVLLDRASHPDLEIFRIFEEAISVLNENLTSSLRSFRAEGFRDKAFDSEPVENKERSIWARHKEEGRRAEEENRDNTSAVLELRDLEDELLVLLHLFEQQTKVVSSMLAIYARPEMRNHTSNGRLFLNEALKRLGDYAHMADEMIQRVRSTRDDYDKLLQMVQRQAQVDEVRLSRLHADLASAQSRSVMIFTVFTVIFLPLSFFTGLFGMNTREWGGGGNLPLQTIGAIALPSSAMLITAALVIAWSTTVRRLFGWFNGAYLRSHRWIQAKTALARTRGDRGGPGHGVQSQGRRRGGDSARDGAQQEASDFWDRHRPERQRGYRIPDVNRKGGETGERKRWSRRK